MRPLFGDLLRQAGDHLDAATGPAGPLPEGAARDGAAVWELSRITSVMERFAVGFQMGGEPGSAPPWDVQDRLAEDARSALVQAATNMRMAVAALGDEAGDRARPAVAHLAATRRSLFAACDLLQTHFAPGPAGLRTGNSPWAPVIVSGRVNAALLAEMGRFARRLAPWAIGVSVPGSGVVTLPAPAAAALVSACQWLRIADGATWAAGNQHPSAAVGRAVLHAVPANTEPPRHPPHGGEPVAALCAGLTATAERLRHLALTSISGTAHQTGAGSATAWQRTAQGAAIAGHHSVLTLESLTGAAAQSGMTATAQTALRQATGAATDAWQAWRAAAHGWDFITTGTSVALTPLAAEVSDLVLWAGRLAHRDPAWTPARSDAKSLRDPADLAGSPDAMRNVLAAVHQTGDALAHIAACEHDAVRAAVARGSLFVPTRLLPERYDVPYRYAPVTPRMADALLAAHDTAIQATVTAAKALDRLAVTVGSPTWVLAELRVAASHGMPHLTHPATTAAEPAAVPPRPGQTERSLRDLGITEPAMLGRAAAIDDAAHGLMADATARSGRQDDAAFDNAYRKKGTAGRAARQAAKDIPSTPAALSGPHAGEVPATATAKTVFHRSAPQDRTPGPAAPSPGRRA